MLRSNIKYEIDENGCHNCTSHKTDKFGYPRINFNRKNITMHRYAYIVLKGKIEKGLVIRHKCDNPKCINIDHLEPGTIQDNVMDRHTRGRTSRQPRTNGEVNGMHKLKKEQVLEIISFKGKFSQTKIASMYNVSQAQIGNIHRGKSWSHLQGA